MNQNTKLVSIILPTFNGASRNNGVYLMDAIKSVLNQTYTNLELIIVNDGSTDNTEKLCKQFHDTRIKYIFQDNKGLSGARNIGLMNCKGEYITFLDDDDIYFPNKLYEQSNYMVKNSIDVSYTYTDKINENGEKITILPYNISGNLQDILLSKGNIINSPASIMLTRDAYKKTGLFKEYLKSSEDWDYWNRLSRNFTMHCLEKSLAGYRIHSSSQMSRNREKMEFYDFLVLMENLMELNIKDKEKYLFQLYKRFTKIDYGVRDFERFQRNYKFAATYGRHNLEWRLKYVLSHFPKVLMFLYAVYFKLKK